MTQRELDSLLVLLKYSMGIQTEITSDQKENIKMQIPVLYEESKRHDLAHLVAFALFENGLISPDDPHFEKFKKMQITAFYREARMTHDLAEIAATFEAAEIPFIPLKGSYMRNYYPEKWMRTSSDIDVLVKKQDLDRALAILMEQKGYTYMSKYVRDVSLRSKNNFHIEVHFSLTDGRGSTQVDRLLDEVWDHASPKQGYKFWYELSDEFFYLYHQTHASKHLLNGGCGIKAFIDIWILENRVAHDNKSRDELLKKADRLTFANVARELAAVWFDSKPIEKEELGWLQSFVLNGGVYGTPLNHMVMQHHIRGGKVGYALKLFFPSYDFMWRYFPILEKHKWLLPFMYPVRWVRSVFSGNTKRVVKILKTSKNTPKEVDFITTELINRLGL